MTNVLSIGVITAKTQVHGGAQVETAAGRSAGIDGLRGLSVLAVILLHIWIRIPFAQNPLGAAFPPWLTSVVFRSGFYGVMTFFVISGFLITTISLERWKSLPRIPVAAFYRLRFARIGPCLLLLLAVLSALHVAGVPGFVIDPATATLPSALLATLTFRINVFQADHGMLPAAWDVLWTLSIEEMFYLLFPLVCRVARSEFVIVVVLLAVAVAGPLARVFGPHENDMQDQTYLCCMDGIAWGCIAALAVRHVRFGILALRTMFVVGLALAIFIDAFRKAVFESGLVSTGLYVTVLEVGVALLLIAIQRGTAERFFARGTGALRFFGRNSYEIYLTHMFVVLGLTAFYRTTMRDTTTPLWYVAIIAMSGGLGYIVAHFYSNPLNARIRRLCTPNG
jgi:peptidoglycan/LPS O-acetylase OafA/YrhL